MSATSSRNLLPVAFAATVLLLIAGAYFMGRGRAPGQPAPVVSPEPASAAVQAPPNVMPAPPPVAVQQEALLQRRQTQAKLDGEMQAIAARYSNERVDPAWADAKQQKLAGAADSAQMRELHASIRDLQIDCRTSLCRITGDFASRTAGDDWMTLFATGVGTEMAHATYAIQPNSDGSVRIEVYGEGR